jgi:hypothetical protein
MKQENFCRRCNCDISHRQAHAKYCLSCGPLVRVDSGRTLATRAVMLAVRSGKLPRASTLLCVDCGAQALDYDHRDYNFPLAVDPVCRQCNMRRGPAIPLQRSAA